jgi:hypothetical protein
MDARDKRQHDDSIPIFGQPPNARGCSQARFPPYVA